MHRKVDLSKMTHIHTEAFSNLLKDSFSNINAQILSEIEYACEDSTCIDIELLEELLSLYEEAL